MTNIQQLYQYLVSSLAANDMTNDWIIIFEFEIRIMILFYTGQAHVCLVTLMVSV